MPELSVSEIFGIRTFWDLQQNQEKHGDEDWQNRMMKLELRVLMTRGVNGMYIYACDPELQKALLEAAK